MDSVCFNRILTALVCLATACSCASSREGWTAAEEEIIGQEEPVLRVLQVTDKADGEVLRRISSDIPVNLVGGDCWRKLSSHLLATVQDEANPGVGIAGPQVGISRRVVAVQRFDKEGEPFEVYPNIRITAGRGEREYGPEGCLSVPDRRGDVLRWQEIDIMYTSPATLADTCETVLGYTAVIFQHECDHLDGLLYTDRLDAQDNPERIADDIRVSLDHENGLYDVGETVTVTAGMLGIYGKGLEMTVLESGRRGETVTLGNIGLKDTVYVCTPTEPTAVMLEFRPEGGTPVEMPRDVNMNEDSFRIGFVAGARTYAPGNPVPKDVREFWDTNIARMRETPIEARLCEVRVGKKDSAAVECFDVHVNGPDGVPVVGYYARPRGAAPGSLPIVLRFHSAGVSGSWCRSKVKDAVSYAKKGAVCFDFNAHGMENGREQAYYDSLAAGPLEGYSDRPLEDRETYYFKNMILRTVRGLDYASQDPAWDGRTVLVLGESQGGYQAAMLSGLDSRVTDVIVNVPAGVGTGGSRAGRRDSWPGVLEDSSFSQYAMDNAAYFDAAILLRGCKARCLVEVGLVDVTCPAPEVFSGFNSVAGEVRFLTCPYRPHHLAKVAPQYRTWWDDNVGDVRSAAIDDVISRGK